MTEVRPQIRIKFINGTALKLLAMLFMLTDHLAKAFFIENNFLLAIGRLAFPIFAFQIAEGYRHTSDFKKYLKRMFIYALISEIPYNLMGGSPINPAGQNVLFTFCIALLLIRLIDLGFKKHFLWGALALTAGTFAAYYIAFALFTDYMGYGVLTVVAFWLFGQMKFGKIFEFLSIAYINWAMIAGLSFTVTVGGHELWIPMQAFAILSLIPIFLYNGKRGPGGKKFQHAVYIFYPLHMAVIGIITLIISLS